MSKLLAFNIYDKDKCHNCWHLTFMTRTNATIVGILTLMTGTNVTIVGTL